MNNEHCQVVPMHTTRYVNVGLSVRMQIGVNKIENRAGVPFFFFFLSFLELRDLRVRHLHFFVFFLLSSTESFLVDDGNMRLCSSTWRAALLICLKRSPPRRIPPNHLDTTTSTFFTSSICNYIAL